jgi:UDP-N-acetyl-D-galactosamine dehydrogenase
VVAVRHREFAALGAQGLRAFGKPDAVLYDVKYVLPSGDVDGRL